MSFLVKVTSYPVYTGWVILCDRVNHFILKYLKKYKRYGKMFYTKVAQLPGRQKEMTLVDLKKTFLKSSQECLKFFKQKPQFLFHVHIADVRIFSKLYNKIHFLWVLYKLSDLKVSNIIAGSALFDHINHPSNCYNWYHFKWKFLFLTPEMKRAKNSTFKYVIMESNSADQRSLQNQFDFFNENLKL